MVQKNLCSSSLMIPTINSLPEGKKIFFLSDFHLGVPSHASSVERERTIIRFLEEAEKEMHALFIIGDLFDFWFEYKYVVPKGFVRILGKLASLSDKGIPIYLFKGNHDMWMFGYLEKELGAVILDDTHTLKVGATKILVGHGDGLGPGDHFYKFLRKVFRNPICQWAFGILPPRIGMWIAQQWSKKSRIQNMDEKFLGENEWLFQYCKEREQQEHFDYYVFGHRHLPLEMKVNEKSTYVNLGEWVNYFTYGVFDGKTLQLKKF